MKHVVVLVWMTVLVLVLAACGAATPGPTPSPSPTVVTPLGSVSGQIDAYAGGAASIVAVGAGPINGESFGSLVGAVDADGRFTLTLTDGYDNAALDLSNADEVEEIYGNCLQLSRSWRVGTGSLEVFTGPDLDTRTFVQYVRPFDPDDPVTLVDLTYIRPVPADAELTVRVRLPIEITQVQEAGFGAFGPPVSRCGTDERAFTLREGWYWTYQRFASYSTTLPNGDIAYYNVITAFDLSDEGPADVRFVEP